MRIFVINPGSTSTKLALYEDETAVVSREFQHDKAELSHFATVMDQLDFRMAVIRQFLTEADINTALIDGVAGRGGMLHPLEGGVYTVSDAMIADLRKARYGEHPCNLGAILAHELAQEWQLPAFIVDPVVTDEMIDVARITGFPGIKRRSLFHALSQRGAARTVAARRGVSYESANFIVCHMGGGISIGAHRHGKVVDVVNALDGEGPMSPERTGGLPALALLDLIERGEYTPAELKRIIVREGGLFAHLGTNDLRQVIARADNGDTQAGLLFQALAYIIAKHIAALGPAFADANGTVAITAIIVTGGLARSRQLVDEISKMTGYLAPSEVVIGNEEMVSLANGAARVIKGTEKARTYTPETSSQKT